MTSPDEKSFLVHVYKTELPTKTQAELPTQVNLIRTYRVYADKKQWPSIKAEFSEEYATGSPVSEYECDIDNILFDIEYTFVVNNIKYEIEPHHPDVDMSAILYPDAVPDLGPALCVWVYPNVDRSTASVCAYPDLAVESDFTYDPYLDLDLDSDSDFIYDSDEVVDD